MGKRWEEHFDKVAGIHAEIRDTDPDVVERIVSHLEPAGDGFKLADVGCGTGRYTVLIPEKLDLPMTIFCCDSSAGMLAECMKRFDTAPEHAEPHFFLADAHMLPFLDGTMDAVVTFNALHHFELHRFLEETNRLLAPGGVLAIYTRTPDQNERTIWGRYFPGFCEKEDRLYERSAIKEALRALDRLELVAIEDVVHVRSDTIASLIEKARNHHYSTFALYEPDELEEALSRFRLRLLDVACDGVVKHRAENTLVLARRIDAP